MRYIYVIRNLINQKVYVGQTINPTRRKAGHFCAARKGDDYPLPRAIRKYGEQNFVFEILEECTDDKIDEREKFWIAHLNSRNQENGYNLAIGGRSTSVEQHRKLSKALTGNKHCVGRKVSVETRYKTGSSHRGKTLSATHRLSLSINCKEQRGEKNSMFGRRGAKSPNAKLTQEQADEIRNRLKNGELQYKLASEFHVSRFTISRVGNGSYVI